ncbi:protoporphyrinogen oxidase, partial [Actinoplanes sp. NPDC051411]|uniref:protoporphyrinogen oxidase n=1 Tax=Actinoplanes sp. NPDC051411 TaxID=3155522 RepID=UPI003440F82B
TVDLGPNGFVDNGTDTRTLAEELGLAAELRRAAPAGSHRYLVRSRRMDPLPSTVAGVLTTPLLPPTAKLRLLAEPFAGPPPAGDETVLAFAARHFGPVAARRLAIPAVHGVTAGEAGEISVDALLPRLRQLEAEHPRLLTHLLRLRWRAWRAGGPPSPRLTSFAGAGMQRLVDALVTAAGTRLRLRSPVRALDRDDDGSWRLLLADGEPVTSRQVVLAVPAHAAAPLLAPWHPGAADHLAAVRYADIRVTALGYRAADLGVPADGFGFLTCPAEPAGRRRAAWQARILGAVFTTAIFPDQGPAGHVLLRAFAGGTADPGFADLPRDAAVETVRRDLGTILRIGTAPRFAHDHVWRRAIPQYAPRHRARMDEVSGAVAALSGLHVAGSAYHGVAVNDCVRDGRRVAAQAVARVPAAQRFLT